MTNWRLAAACRGENPDLFFTNSAAMKTKAKRICATCPVRLPCFQEIMAAEAREQAENEDTPWSNLKHRHGIYAGYTGLARWSMVYPDLRDQLREKNRRNRDYRTEAAT